MVPVSTISSSTTSTTAAAITCPKPSRRRTPMFMAHPTREIGARDEVIAFGFLFVWRPRITQTKLPSATQRTPCHPCPPATGLARLERAGESRMRNRKMAGPIQHSSLLPHSFAQPTRTACAYSDMAWQGPPGSRRCYHGACCLLQDLEPQSRPFRGLGRTRSACLISMPERARSSVARSPSHMPR